MSLNWTNKNSESHVYLEGRLFFFLVANGQYYVNMSFLGQSSLEYIPCSPPCHHLHPKPKVTCIAIILGFLFVKLRMGSELSFDGYWPCRFKLGFKVREK